MRSRPFVVAAFVAASLAACSSGPARTSASDSARTAVLTSDEQKALKPAEVVAELKAGNERFVRGKTVGFDYRAQVKPASAGQYPKAIVLGCVDSRVPPEVVFDQGLGDIFVARIAGNFENTDILGSMEFATAVSGAKAIVVLGHTNCGAVKGAIDQVQLGNLTDTLANLAPAVDAAKTECPQGPFDSHNKALLNAALDANVRITMRDILEYSDVLRERVAKGDLVIAGGVYDLETGAIRWVDAN
ncbi:MAG: carbonic anhydrase [Phycisphaerae bacterium]|nr:carbonic anhydrase [Phycisphaerae bacterium]